MCVCVVVVMVVTYIVGFDKMLLDTILKEDFLILLFPNQLRNEEAYKVTLLHVAGQISIPQSSVKCPQDRTMWKR